MRNNTSSTTGAAAGDVRLREPRGASPEMRRGGVAGAGPRRRCAAGLELGLTGDVPRGPLLELRGAASRGGSHRRCAVLRAAGDLAGDAPRGPRKKKLGRFIIFFGSRSNRRAARIERLWLDRPKVSAGAPAPSGDLG